MKSLLTFFLLVALLSVAVTSDSSAQGAAFTYQGRLNDDGRPANGLFDLRFSLFGVSSDGSTIAGPLTHSAVAVSDGLFTVLLDFGAGGFTGADRWLDIAVRPAGVGTFTPLNPRQPVTATPYALHSANATTATTAGSASSVAAPNIIGTLALAQLPGTLVTNNQPGVNLAGTFAGNGGALSNLSPNSLVLISTNASVTTWGGNDSGQRSVPAGLDDVVAMAAGLAHSLALKADGTVVAWGAGTTKLPGSIDSGQSIVPASLNNVRAVSAGYVHSLALKADRTVVAWGAGTTNDPGTIDSGQSIVPAGLSNVIAVSAGGVHNLALKMDGTVVAWGAGATNNPGTIDSGQSIVPAGLNNVRAVSGGYAHSLALKADRTVVAWGAGTTNDPGTIDSGQSIVPAGLSNVIAVSAGGVHNLALKMDGTVVAWGAGATNDPTDGINFGQSIVPAGLSNVVAIAAGFFHSLALKADGTVVAWGNNQVGQASAPAGLNNVVALAPGPTAQHALVLRKRSAAPVAWLDSDNTFNGTIQVNGDVHVSGEMTAADGFRLNDGDLWFRGGADRKNGLGWYGTNKSFAGITEPAPDGPVLFGFAGGALGTTTNGQKVALFWDSSQRVGIGTTTPASKFHVASGAGDQAPPRVQSSSTSGFAAGWDFYQGNTGKGYVGVPDSAAPFAPGEMLMFGGPGTKVSLWSGGARSLTADTAGNVQVRGDIRMGPSGQLHATSSEENLRIVRGVVNAVGTILEGTGFTVTKTEVGSYTVTFTTPFSGIPAVTATAQSGNFRIATVTSVTASAVPVRTHTTSDLGRFYIDNQFHFIAIGPR